jgi:putative SOS response-associated peptidase YedK
MFRDAFRSGRCLVPADGFLEWRREGGVNQPYLFRTDDSSVFTMAGLWKEGRYVVLTQDSDGEVEDIHDRMPVILSGERARAWLIEGGLSESPPLIRTAVSPRINRIENDDPRCIEPLPQAAFEFD